MIKKYKFLLAALFTFSILLAGCGDNNQDQPADNAPGVEDNNDNNMDEGNMDNNPADDDAGMGDELDDDLDDTQDEMDDMIDGNDDDTNR